METFIFENWTTIKAAMDIFVSLVGGFGLVVLVRSTSRLVLHRSVR